MCKLAFKWSKVESRNNVDAQLEAFELRAIIHEANISSSNRCAALMHVERWDGGSPHQRAPVL